MNRKDRRLTQSKAKNDSQIHFGCKHYTLNEAFALAVEQQKLKHYGDAEALYRLIISKYPDHASSLNNLGLLLYQRSDANIDEVISLYRRAIRRQPDYAFAYHNLGNALLSKGDIIKAEEMILKSLSLNPNYPRLILSLAHIRKYKSADHADILHIRHLLGNPGLITEGKELLYFALGKMYDDCGLYDEAFEAYRKANDIRNASFSYNPDLTEQQTSNIIEVFSKTFCAREFAFASNSEQPLFIVGMPRSGTTLLASILSNHRDIKSAGELTTIVESATRLPGLLGNDLVSYPQAAAFMSPSVASMLIKHYEKRLRRGINSSTTYIIDKQPTNFWHLGFIAMLFPKARILHCTRNAMDTCLSNYFQNFDDAYEYSFDLGNIGHCYLEYARLMAHWQKVLPTSMIEINYEDTVLNMEQTTRKALEFLGLEWDERCLSPHTNSGTVATASKWQVCPFPKSLPLAPVK